LSIICTCGCRVEDLDETYNVICKSETCGEEGYQKAITHQTLCRACKEEYDQEGLTLKDESEAIAWLFKKG
jgi:hypothetical protein